MKKTVKIMIPAMLAFVAFAACKNDEKKTEQVDVTPLVAVQKAVVEDIADEQTYSSTVQPWAKNNIAPQTAGRIEELLVEVGDYVNAGQIIARMDDVQLRQAELQIANDKVEYERIHSLYQEGGLSQSDFDAFEMAYKVHQSTYENLLKNTVLRSPIG